MRKVPQKHTHFSLPIELRFRAIPTTWTAGENSDGERVLFPSVSQSDKIRLAKISDPSEIRKQLFKLKPDEQSVLNFLNGVGVWSAVQDMRGKDGAEGKGPRIQAMRFQGAYGHRSFNGRAVVATVESIRDEQKYWRGLFGNGNRANLRAAYGPPPSGDGSSGQAAWFARMGSFGNTLSVHLEWRGKHPHLVIQPITGRELLTALAWIDLVSGAVVKVCQNPNCGVEYTHGRTKFCTLECERANTKRAYRHRIKQAEDIIRANPKLSIRALLEKLTEAGVKRGREWVVNAKAGIASQGGETKSGAAKNLRSLRPLKPAKKAS